MMRTALIVITGAYGAGGGIAAVNRLSIRALLENNYFLKVIALNEIAPIYVDIGQYANNYHQTACQGNENIFCLEGLESIITSQERIDSC